MSENAKVDLHELFVNIPEALIAIAPDYTVLEVTNKYLTLVLRTREQLMGSNLLEAFPDSPEDDSSKNTSLLRQSIDKTFREKIVNYFEPLRYDIVRPSAQGGGYETRYWEASHTPILDEAGEVKYIIRRTSNVTQRELAKRAHLEMENKFKYMTDAVPQLIHTADTQGNVTYVNQRWLNYTGLSAEELLGTGWRNTFHPDDLAAVQKKMDVALPPNEEFQAEVRIRNKEGNYRWHLTKSLPLVNLEGAVNMRVGSNTDIHDAKIMVQELLATNEQMSQLSDQVHLAFQKVEAERSTLERLILRAPGLFCILKGSELRFELVNPAYQELYPGRELLHKTVAEALPEIVDQGFLEVLQSVYQTGQDFVAEEIPFTLYRFADQAPETIYFNFTYQAIFDENNKVSGILGFGYDVTPQVTFKQKLKELGYDTNKSPLPSNN
ncbi:PAS domain-containing protein [Adhaeribacter radiodurans]|uniref:histidine kinase n=1 Tax=Adhaeribacter radiodurans TaxID=2745197 RepID=A0A7L7L805_9BACT|nr:PAS domain-containing protein [Adhaeribacter radiodurans]QMU28884.1 PAS domain-containing protein [Adhaeribacter radiodurans]